MLARVLTVGAVAALIMPTEAAVAQGPEPVRAPSGISAGGLGYVAPSRLGGGSGVGWNAGLLIGASPNVSVEGSWARVGGLVTEGIDPRGYTLDMPSLGLRARLMGRENGLDLLLSGGAMRHSLRAAGANPAEVRTVPFVAPGFALRQRIAGPVRLDFSVRAPLSYARAGELTATPGDRGLATAIDVRVNLSLLRRARVAAMGGDDIPVVNTDGWRPVAPGDPVPVRAAPPAGVTYPAPAPAPVVARPAAPRPVVQAEVGPVRTAPGTERRHLTTVYFPSDSAVAVSGEYREILRDVALFLEQNPSARLDLVAFTEHPMAPTQSLSLAERRGTEVRSLLVRVYGVSAARIGVTAIGSDYDTTNPRLARRVDVVAVLPQH